jgi:site-specific recombinase XerD
MYLEHEKNMSPKTLENYSLWLGRMLASVGDIEIQQLNQMMLLDRRMSLKQRGLSMKTINYHVTAVRAFLKFCHKMDIDCLGPEKLELAKIPPREVAHLTEEEVKTLIDAPLTHEHHHLKQLRDRAILQTLYGSGLRVTELTALRRNQIPTEGQQMSIIGKGQKMRSVFLTREAAKAISDYLLARSDMNPAVFVSVSNNGVTGK